MDNRAPRWIDPIGLELIDEIRPETSLQSNRYVCEPLDLGAPLAANDEDCELVEIENSDATFR